MRIKIKTGIYNTGRRSRRLRLFIFLEGENVLENLKKRFDRPYEFYREEILPVVERRLGLEDVVGKATWSQKCGCSCGCSPGFWLTLTDDRFTMDKISSLDYDTIYATVSGIKA